MEPFILEEKEFFIIDDWRKKEPSLLAGFSSKNGGTSTPPYFSLNLGFHVGDRTLDVCKNRRIMANLVEFPNEAWVGAEQTHGIHVHKVTEKDKGKGALHYDSSFKSTDGFFTMEKGMMLTLLFADCVPLFFFAPKRNAVGIAHAGWKGTVGGIAAKMIEVFQEEDIPSSDILVTIGPSICEKCYIVDNPVITLVQNILEDVEEKPYNLIKENQFLLDLKLLNKQILIRNGILEKNIQITKYCSSCHSDHFFSHRRDKGKTGRMMGFIGIKED